MVVMVQYWDEEENKLRSVALCRLYLLGQSLAVDSMDKLN